MQRKTLTLGNIPKPKREPENKKPGTPFAPRKPGASSSAPNSTPRSAPNRAPRTSQPAALSPLAPVAAESPAPRSASLGQALVHATHVCLRVRAGDSLNSALADRFYQVHDSSLRAAIQAITFEAMRYRGRADALKAILVTRPTTHAWVDELLTVSLALLCAPNPMYPTHTLTHQAVLALEIEPEVGFAKGFVNGVLRRYIRESETLNAQLAPDPIARWNLPKWWLKVLRTTYPDQWEQLAAQAHARAPLTLRINQRKTTRPEYLELLRAAGIEAVASTITPAAVVLPNPVPVQRLPGFDAGLFSVQDAGAQLAAHLLKAQDGMRVLDACAAPGGKTAHILELTDVHLTALDHDDKRLARIEQNLARLGLQAAQLCTADASNPATWWDGQLFDRILADVPCTATGIVRRHPDIAWLRRETDVQQTAVLQQRIADALWSLLKPGGTLVYVTCSVLPAEGVQQAQAFAQRHTDCVPQSLQGNPHWSFVTARADGQLLPTATAPADQHDGFFYAVFQKR